MNETKKDSDKKKYDPKKEIENLSKKDKIYLTDPREAEALESVGFLPLVHNELLSFLERGKNNGYYILYITDPKNKKHKFPFKIKYEGNEETEIKKPILKKIEVGGLNEQQIKTLLEKRKLWDYIIDELDKKHIGDIPAKEIVFLSVVGRLVENKKPYSFNIILHSSSSAGKDHLVESVLKLFPEEDIEAFGRISKTALTYLHDSKKEPFFSYDGKILYLEEITEEILNNEIMKVFTAGLTKSAITKEQKAEVVEVKGKPVVICTSATTKPAPEILNRFSIVQLDESEEQTRRTFLMDEEEYNEGIRTFLLELKSYKVNVPPIIKKKIAKVFPAKKTQLRRAFPRFLDLMRAVAIFHQDLKKKSKGEINTSWEDYDLAVRIFNNYRSGIASIPLKKEDQRIIDLLEKSDEPLSAPDISKHMEGYLSKRRIYDHLNNLENNEILISLDLKDPFGNPVKKYEISEEFKDKNPIKLPDSSQIS